jgi:hypothetical protein
MKSTQNKSDNGLSALFVFWAVLLVITYFLTDTGVQHIQGLAQGHTMISILCCSLDLFIFLPLIFVRYFKSNPSRIWYCFGVWLLFTAAYSLFIRNGIIITMHVPFDQQQYKEPVTFVLVCLWGIRVFTVATLFPKLLPK